MVVFTGDTISRAVAEELDEKVEGLLFLTLPKGSFTVHPSTVNLSKTREVVYEYNKSIVDDIDLIDTLVILKKLKVKAKKTYVNSNPALKQLIKNTHFNVYKDKLILLGHIPINEIGEYADVMFNFLDDESKPFALKRLAVLLEEYPFKEQYTLGQIYERFSPEAISRTIDNVTEAIHERDTVDVEYIKMLTSDTFDALMDFLLEYLSRTVKLDIMEANGIDTIV